MAYLVVTPPEAEEPVEPLVPDPLLVPAVPPLPDGSVELELPDAPIPDVVPELEVPAVPGLVEEGEAEPLADPPAEPMPDAVPEAEPDMLGPEPQAASEVAHTKARINLPIRTPLSCCS